MRTPYRSILAALLLTLCAAIAQAQTTTSYTLKIYAQGATQPTSTTSLQAQNFVCGQPQLPATATNPTRVQFNDPADPTKACEYRDPGTGPLFALPFGPQNYTATLTAVNGAGASPESAASLPFSHPGAAAAAPTGVHVTR